MLFCQQIHEQNTFRLSSGFIPDRVYALDKTEKGSTTSVLSIFLTFTKSVTASVAVSTRSPAIAEGPRDAGVPVEIW